MSSFLLQILFINKGEKYMDKIVVKETSELEWKGNRFLARLNYLIHTETNNLIFLLEKE